MLADACESLRGLRARKLFSETDVGRFVREDANLDSRTGLLIGVLPLGGVRSQALCRMQDKLILGGCRCLKNGQIYIAKMQNNTSMKMMHNVAANREKV